MARTETVVSELLCVLPVKSEPSMPQRSVDPDFADSVASGYVESADDWITRTGATRAALVTVDPADLDAVTKRAALRREICLARGVDPADICPAMGYDLSADAFGRARDGWADHLAAHRPSDWTYSEHDRARAFWAKARPDLIDDWPEVQR